jgi:putative transposase
VKPGIVVGWHRKGFRLYWTWKSRPRLGRPKINAEARKIIQEMSRANPLWGAPRIHGELLKLGIDVSQATVAKYKVRIPGPPSPSWRTFLDNHVSQLAFGASLCQEFGSRFSSFFVVLAHDRRRVLHFNVTAHPTAAWTAQQILEAFPFEAAPKYLLRDRDAIYGHGLQQQIGALGITEVLGACRSPWQRAYIERIIGSIRRECLDHVIVFDQTSLRHILGSYLDYYHRSRTHLSLNKDAPVTRPVQPVGRIVAIPQVGGLHHRYERLAA